MIPSAVTCVPAAGGAAGAHCECLLVWRVTAQRPYPGKRCNKLVAPEER